MKRIPLLLLSATLTLVGCNNTEKTSALNPSAIADRENKSIDMKKIKAKNRTNDLSCKLTTPELLQRKETVLKDLKEQVLIKKNWKMATLSSFRVPTRYLTNSPSSLKQKGRAVLFSFLAFPSVGTKAKLGWN